MKQIITGTVMDELSEKIKHWEALSDHVLNSTLPIICRIDGHRFSQFTKHFNKPFDERLHKCMLDTAKDLMHFVPECKVAYTQSDEISLFFDSMHYFKGRIQKIVSLTASYASVRFDHHFSIHAPDVYKEHGSRAHFDARVFNVNDHNALYDVYHWRSWDAKRNSKVAFGLQFFTQKEIHKLSSQRIVEKAAAEGKDYETLVPTWARAGTSIARIQVVQTAINKSTLLEKEYTRAKLKEVDGTLEKSEFLKLFSCVPVPV